FDLASKISPDILLIIIILSIIFFISGLIHILVKFLLMPSTQNREDYFDNNVTALQGQLQQLFYLHSYGIDQSLIDTLPVFHYKSITGLKISPFDCPVCLCDHAFQVDCIDTWLLSHSTCPLSRSNLLLPDFSFHHSPSSPYLVVLESASGQISRDMVSVTDAKDFGSTHFESVHGNVVPLEVKLGKFRNMDHVGEGPEGSNNKNSISGNSNGDVRRCFTMGLYEYIVDQEATLKVHVRTKKQSDKDGHLSVNMVVMSESGFDPRVKRSGKSVAGRESFSFLKNWLRGKKEVQKANSVRDQEYNGANIVEENQKSENPESLETKTLSFARRTMLCLAGRQNKVVHPSTSHV
ncbi:hypothetical protein N665_0383s0148, partial [Sinapis alba]